MIKNIIIKYREWKVAKRIKQLKRNCEWVEGYLKSSRLPRANRRALIKSFGKLALRIALYQDKLKP